MEHTKETLPQDSCGISEYPTRIDLCDGKYTIIYDFKTGRSECLRYGNTWRQLAGDKMVLACFDEIVELRKQRDELLEALISAVIAKAT